MEQDIYELFLRECKTQQKAGNEIKVSQSSISKMRSGERPIAFNIAERITRYLRKKTGLLISPESLITSIKKKKRELSYSNLFYELPIQFSPINLELVKTIYNNNYHAFEIKIDSKKLIIIDEYYYLISDDETYFFIYKTIKK